MHVFFPLVFFIQAPMNEKGKREKLKCTWKYHKVCLSNWFLNKEIASSISSIGCWLLMTFLKGNYFCSFFLKDFASITSSLFGVSGYPQIHILTTKLLMMLILSPQVSHYHRLTCMVTCFLQFWSLLKCSVVVWRGQMRYTFSLIWGIVDLHSKYYLFCETFDQCFLACNEAVITLGGLRCCWVQCPCLTIAVILQG